MAWVPPRTWAVGEVVSDTLLNQHLRDNLLAGFPTTAGTPDAASTAYSPNWSAGAAVTLGTNLGRYRRIGRFIQATGQMSASGTATTGGFISSAPVAPAVTNVAVPLGVFSYWPNGGGARGIGVAVYTGSGAGIQFWVNGSTTVFGGAVAIGDLLNFDLFYESAT